jgi:hypothetical protein
MNPDTSLKPSGLPPSGTWTADSLHAHFTTRQHDIEASTLARLDDLQKQLDRRIATQERERIDAERHLMEAVQGLRREVETITKESQRAVSEAGREREKAAQALSTNMSQTIKEGDERLREHIEGQVKQIEAALEAARRETEFAHIASQKAIDKAEVGVEKRFSQVNAFREELSDRWERTMPREVAETWQSEYAKRMDKAEHELDKRAGAESAIEDRKAAVQPWMIWAAGALLAVVIVVVNILTVLGGPP